MFTGLIEEMGEVVSIDPLGDGRRLHIKTGRLAADMKIDDSIAVNGCCLTAVSVHGDTFVTEAVEETLRKTTIGKLEKGDPVNLERALRLSDRLGGHLVLGHVDGVGRITSIEPRSTSWMIGVEIPEDLSTLVIPVGSIAIDGISLTAAGIERSTVFVSIIPHTWSKTTVSRKRVGDAVNVEVDMVGKYVARLLPAQKESKITEEWLKEKGFL
jgi:riboflavin synthase